MLDGRGLRRGGDARSSNPRPAGALARPFFTHANALDIDLSLRIAPELYLKRLVVGGYERVFEIARNFRNEGIDTRHSPEFTSLEAYRAFGDVHDGMDLTERLIVAAAEAATGRHDVRRWAAGRSTSPRRGPGASCSTGSEEVVGTPPAPRPTRSRTSGPVCASTSVDYLPEWGSGKLIFELYDNVILPDRRDPVFVVGFPVEVSPLARRTAATTRPWPTGSSSCIDGREFANGYSELNIPEEQEERFVGEADAVAQGDLEAHPADLAFIRALEYGLPPTSGIGIGIDRLVMLLAEVEAIRDVILFPMLRPEAPA